MDRNFLIKIEGNMCMKHLLITLLITTSFNLIAASSSSNLCIDCMQILDQINQEKKCNDLVIQANSKLEVASDLISKIKEAPARARVKPYTITLPHLIHATGAHIAELKRAIQKVQCCTSREKLRQKRENLKQIYGRYKKYETKEKMAEVFLPTPPAEIPQVPKDPRSKAQRLNSIPLPISS